MAGSACAVILRGITLEVCGCEAVRSNEMLGKETIMNAYELALQLAEKAKQGQPTKVTREFLSQFDAVCKYYGCTPEEIEEMKAVARKDMEQAKICFASVYERIQAC